MQNPLYTYSHIHIYLFAHRWFQLLLFNTESSVSGPKFIEFGINVSTENDINTRLMKAWTAINRLLVIWNQTYPTKKHTIFFKAAFVSKLLRPILNKYWKQHTTKQQLYGYFISNSKTIHIRRTRHAGHCWRIKEELISDLPPWTPSHEHVSVVPPART